VRCKAQKMRPLPCPTPADATDKKRLENDIFVNSVLSAPMALKNAEEGKVADGKVVQRLPCNSRANDKP